MNDFEQGEMMPLGRFMLLVIGVVCVLVLLSLNGCTHQYREASKEVAEEFAFQEAIDRARIDEYAALHKERK